MEERVERLEEIYTVISTFLVTYSFQIIGALIILVVGLMVARKVSNSVENLMLRHEVDVTLSRFTARGCYIVIVAIVAVMALSKIGISITPLVATIGAASLGAGLAMQGMLSNYAAGISIIVTRPFVVGNTISVQGVTGMVKLVSLASTVLTTEDNVEITVPNKHIIGEIIHNSFGNSIVETRLCIAYSADSELATKLIVEAIRTTPGVATEPEPQVGIEDFGENGFIMGLRYWARTEVLFQTRYAVNARIRDEFAKRNIVLTYPQREVRVLQ